MSLGLLFLLSMFFSSAETAFLSLNKLKLRFLREQNNRAAAKAEKILQNKQKFLSTILIGNSIVNITISAVLTTAALRVFGDTGLGIAVAAGTALLLIFGEILPKSLALVYPDAMSLAFARLILLLMTLLSPAVKLFSAITGFLLRLCGIRQAKNTAAVTEEDLRDFFQAREESGFIGSDERILLTNILRYGDFSVRSVMTPRRDIAAIHIGASAEEIIELAKTSRFSRFPVYGTSIDSIQGFFYIKDFLFSSEYIAGNASFQVSSYLRKPLFVFETAKLAHVEKKFHTEKQNMAIVLDEYGGTAGLITVEDISEEIFGSILDEYDIKEAIEQTGNGDAVCPKRPAETAEKIPFTVSGTTRLSDLNEQLNTALKSKYGDTIGGYIMEKAGEIPPAGYSITATPYTFTVAEIKANRITRVEVRMHVKE